MQYTPIAAYFDSFSIGFRYSPSLVFVLLGNLRWGLYFDFAQHKYFDFAQHKYFDFAQHKYFDFAQHKYFDFAQHRLSDRLFYNKFYSV